MYDVRDPKRLTADDRQRLAAKGIDLSSLAVIHKPPTEGSTEELTLADCSSISSGREEP